MKISSIDDVHGHSLDAAILFPTMVVVESIALALLLGLLGIRPCWPALSHWIGLLMTLLLPYLLWRRSRLWLHAARRVSDMHPVGAYPHPWAWLWSLVPSSLLLRSLSDRWASFFGPSRRRSWMAWWRITLWARLSVLGLCSTRLLARSSWFLLLRASSLFPWLASSLVAPSVVGSLFAARRPFQSFLRGQVGILAILPWWILWYRIWRWRLVVGL